MSNLLGAPTESLRCLVVLSFLVGPIFQSLCPQLYETPEIFAQLLSLSTVISE